MLGEGILKGLAETARNFAGSFVSKERLTTVEYPEERLPLPEASRNFPFLVYDGGDWEKGLRCVACQICEKECPPKCIFIEKSKDKKPDFVGKPQIYPAKFDIDISVCMSCQICVEVCPFEAIKMDTEFELCDRRPLRRTAAGSQAAGEVERVLPPDSSDRSGGGGRAAGRGEGKGGGEGQGRGGRRLLQRLLPRLPVRLAAGRRRADTRRRQPATKPSRRRAEDMIEQARPDLCSAEALDRGISAWRDGRPLVGVILSVVCDHVRVSRAVCADRRCWSARAWGACRTGSARTAWVRSGFCSRLRTASSR